jgi:hypothetical protein
LQTGLLLHDPAAHGGTYAVAVSDLYLLVLFEVEGYLFLPKLSTAPDVPAYTNA